MRLILGLVIMKEVNFKHGESNRLILSMVKVTEVNFNQKAKKGRKINIDGRIVSYARKTTMRNLVKNNWNAGELIKFVQNRETICWIGHIDDEEKG